jgi:hypothetical protein
MRFYHGLSQTEIAGRTGIPLGTVKMRMVQALDRMNAPEACRFFYTEHVEADAVHEQVLRREVIGDLLTREPRLAADVVFGIQATELLESRLAEHALKHWRKGRSALRRPLNET